MTAAMLADLSELLWLESRDADRRGDLAEGDRFADAALEVQHRCDEAREQRDAARRAS